MRILNAYCGIGGNRKLWGGADEITAVEWDTKIASIYQEFFPDDKVIVADAHQYLLEHYKEYDFIWSSPPCPTHSRMQKLRVMSDDKRTGNYLSQPTYPDMAIYQEIILLQNYFEGKWCVENVISYYKPLITPYAIAKHFFWTNFFIREIPSGRRGMGKNETQEKLEIIKGFNLEKYTGIDKRKALRNCVEPETGLWVFQEAFKGAKTLF